MDAAVTITRSGSRGTRIAFYVFTVIGALMFGGLFFGLPALVTGWFGDDPQGHRIHGISHGITVGLLLTAAFLVQLRSPGRRVAAAQQTVVVAAFLIIPFLLWSLFASGTALQPMIVIFLVLAIVAVAIPIALHPARAELAHRGSVSRPLLAVAATAGLGAAYYAALQLGAQFGEPPGEIHAKEFHYGGSASAVLAIAAVALLASLGANGWRFAAWSAGVACALYGLAGMLYPDARSSLGGSAGAVAIITGIAFVALAERERRRAT